MNQYKTTYREMKPFLMLWSTQSFSALGERNDQLRTCDLVVHPGEIGIDDRAFDGVFLRTVCDFQYFLREHSVTDGTKK